MMDIGNAHVMCSLSPTAVLLTEILLLLCELKDQRQVQKQVQKQVNHQALREGQLSAIPQV